MSEQLFTQTSKTEPGAAALFAGLGPISPEEAEPLLWQVLPRVLPRLGEWALRTIQSLPASEAHLPGHRDLVPNETETGHDWMYPRSNSPERIDAMLWLASELNDDRYRIAAVKYARAMVDDPLRGIYQGEEEDGRGQVWYWRDVGVYVTNYTIRVPSAMLALADATGESRFREIAELSGKQLLRSQKPQTGILREGWWPENPPEVIRFDPEIRKIYISPFKINSRVGYATRAFADLYRATNDTLYRDGLSLLLGGLEQYQLPNGAFPADIRIDRIEVLDPLLKGHYMTYILNGTARAANLMPQEPVLLRVAERLGQFLVRRYRQGNCLPYGDLNSDCEGERYVWQSSNPDAVYGLAWLSHRIGDPAYREIACRIALSTLLNALDCPDHPDYHGAIPVWPNPHLKTLPDFDGHHHFWTLLGLQALQQTATKSVSSRKARDL